MKLRVLVLKLDGTVLEDFQVISHPSEEAATDVDRNKFGVAIYGTIADKWDVSDEGTEEEGE